MRENTEKRSTRHFLLKRERVLDWLSQELYTDRTPYSQLDEEFQAYESYIVSDLLIDDTGSAYGRYPGLGLSAWSGEETISLSEFLEYAIAQNWVDVTDWTWRTQLRGFLGGV